MRRIAVWALSLLLVVAIAGWLTATQAVAGDPNAKTPALDAKLAAGDLAGALELARAEQDAALRDQLLARVAAAQIESSDLTAAVDTAALMQDDVARTTALRQVAKSRAEAQGGGAAVDFNSLINLITSTIAPDSWDDNGGEGAIESYRAGIIVDSEGVLKRIKREDAGDWLTQLKRDAAARPKAESAKRQSALRKISLTRLERAVSLRRALGKPVDREMLVLAGLQRIEYVMLYPETGDLVIAGPAGDWTYDHEGRTISAHTGRPVVRLDDLITVWRHTASGGRVAMGCSINPVEANLAAAKSFLDESQKKPLKPGASGRWLEEIRSRVGQQDVEIFGIDPHTHVARVLVEADYHMKLVGLGLEPAVIGMPNYLEMVRVEKGQAPPPIDVLRWWFTMQYDALEASPARDAFHIRGQAVRLQSENEMLTDRGQRVHTNQSEPLNRQFAENFTHHYAKLAEKYPVYAELQNLFDLALVGTLIETDGLADRCGWDRAYFGVDGDCGVPQGAAPAKVDTVVNHRKLAGRHIIAGVSGGVHADPRAVVRQMREDKELDSDHLRGAPLAELPRDQWWWD